MRFALILCLTALISCSSPGGKFMKAAPVSVSVEGSEFDIYRVGNEVRIIRLSFEVLPKRAVIFARAIVAVNLATGCRVKTGSMTGDQALMQAKLTC